MNRISAFFLGLLLTTACSSQSPEERAMQAAREAAQASYNHLLAGRYDQFLAGRAAADSFPDSYREQLQVAYKQFVHQQQEAHGGISRAEAVRARIDSTLHVVQVFLLLSYKDQTQEEIVVPMVEHNGVWKMK